MSAKPNAYGPVNMPLSATEGAFAVRDLACAVDARSFSGTHEYEILEPRHHFVSVRQLWRGDRFLTQGSFDGKRYAAHRVYEHYSFFLPRGRRWIGKSKGRADARILICDLEHSGFAPVLGDHIDDLELEPHIGASPVPPGLLERLEALCLTRDAFPRAYADALTAVLAFELFRALATKPLPPSPTANISKSRFKPVLEYIEDTLESDASLSDLASLIGLSVSHFSHAFNAAYGVAPHRYILQRRIDRAKALLRNSGATVAAISARVGFSSQSRFAQIFARHTGITPSAYRQEQLI